MFYSWDIMEPISYLMMFTNFTVGASFYAVNKEEMQLQTLRTMFKKRIAKRMYRKRGIDVNRAEQLEAEILELKSLMNKSVY